MLYLHGLGHFYPETEIDNAFLVSLDIGVDESWIAERVGIRTRRTVLSRDYIRQTRNRNPREAAEASTYTNAQTGAAAASMAIERAGLDSSQIGWLVAGGCSPQWLIPAEACTIAAELGLAATAFDINSACSSFAVQMSLFDRMREALPEFVLLVGAENNTRTVDYSDRGNAVLWGDGSVAAVVSSRVPSRVRVQCAPMGSDPKYWDKVTVRAGDHFAQDGPAVQAFAIRAMGETVCALRSAGAPEDAWFVGHQANLRILESVCRRAAVPPDRHLFNVDRFGNCGAAGAPGVLSQQWDSFRPGDVALVAVAGSGLTWGGLRFDFTNSHD
jgi:3-oxoacyl-[acyl-carrier-protein] synthase-3